jgi:hypothetical protein
MKARQGLFKKEREMGQNQWRNRINTSILVLNKLNKYIFHTIGTPSTHVYLIIYLFEKNSMQESFQNILKDFLFKKKKKLFFEKGF